MDFTQEILANRRALLNDINRRIEAALRPFADALAMFLAILFQSRLPVDWREQWHAFVADQAAKKFFVEPQSVRELEAWIEAWARFCGLLPAAGEANKTDPLRDGPFISDVASDESATVAMPLAAPAADQGSPIELPGFKSRSGGKAPPFTDSAHPQPGQAATPPPTTHDTSGQIPSRDDKPPSPYLYAGRDFDATTGLQYNRGQWSDSFTGRSTTRDSIGFAAGEANPYRYAGNRPTNSIDPSALYAITWATGIWGGPWTAAQKSIVTSSLPRISSRVTAMIYDTKAVRSAYAADTTLCGCERNYILNRMDRLGGVLKSVKNGIASQEYLRLYHYNFDPGSEARTFPNLWSIVFNDAADPPWTKMPAAAFDAVFFHELTHLYGTGHSGEYGQHLNDAVYLTFWYGGQDFLFNASGDGKLRQAARDYCDSIGPLPPTP